MATIGRHNIALMKSSTTGTGTLTLTSAVRGYLTFALAGVVNSERVTYTIRDGADSEVGIGTYTSSGTTLSRDTVLSSTNAGSKISCTGRETVAITIAAEDITPFASYSGSTGDSIANTATDSAITIDTEDVDQAGIATLASNAVTITKKGWYRLVLGILISSPSALNGKCEINMTDFALPFFQGYTTAMNILSPQIVCGPILMNIATDSYSLGTVSFTNNLGGTVTVTVNELSIWKVGNA